MRLIISLGNPGEKYKSNRHNVGAMLVDRLQSTLDSNSSWNTENKLDAVVCRLNAVDVVLAKTTVFMNESGKAVKKIMDFYKIPTKNLYVVYDDLDIPLGSYKIVEGKSPRQHNGVESVEQMLGTKDFWHVRIGIEHRIQDKVNRETGREYVLEDFTKEEQGVINKVLEEVGQKLLDRKANG